MHDPSDIVDTFNFLHNGSYDHYWAFDKALKNRDVADGCCVLDAIDSINYCHPEYPENEKDNEEKAKGRR